jgi:hypothetical protein
MLAMAGDPPQPRIAPALFENTEKGGEKYKIILFAICPNSLTTASSYSR